MLSSLLKSSGDYFQLEYCKMTGVYVTNVWLI